MTILLAVRAFAGSPDDLAAARKALEDRSPALRVEACRRLGELGLREGIPPLIAASRDPVAEVRVAAVDALAVLGDEIAVPHVARGLTDANPTVRGRAALALGKLAGRYAAKRVTPLLGDPDPGVRVCAVQALGEIGDPLRAAEIRKLLDRTKKDPDHVLLTAAIVSLTRLEGAGALDDLFVRVGEAKAFDSWLIRSSLAWAVGEVRDRERIPFLRRAFADRDERVAGAAATALVRLEVMAEVLAALGDDDPGRRRVAVGALVASGDLRHKERILGKTGDPDPRVRLEAIIGLSRLGAREAFPGLLDGLRSPSAMVWGACANELRRAYGRDLGRSTEKWASWYRANRERLAWDTDARVWRVRVR